MININRIVIFGDSLSDFNRMQDSVLGKASKRFGQIAHSPYQRFTNGYAWGDWLRTYLLRSKVKKMSGIELVNEAYSVNYIPKYLPPDTEFIKFKIENYAVGGATAINFKKVKKGNLASNFLDNLSSECDLFLKENKITSSNENQNLLNNDLYIIWAGANDFITAGWDDFECANHATDAILDLIKRLMNYGGQNFVIFNLPFFTAAPRFRLSEEENNEVNKKRNVHLDDLVRYFNFLLNEKVNSFLNQNLNSSRDNINLVRKAREALTRVANDLPAPVSKSVYADLAKPLNNFNLNIEIKDLNSVMINLDENKFQKLEFENEVYPTKITEYKKGMIQIDKSRIKNREAQRLSTMNSNTILTRTSQIISSNNFNPYIDDSKNYKEKFIRKNSLGDKNPNEKNSLLKVYAYHDDVHPGKEIHNLLGIIISKMLNKSFNFFAPTSRSFEI